MHRHHHKNLSLFWISVSSRPGKTCPEYIESIFRKFQHRSTLPLLVETDDMLQPRELINIASGNNDQLPPLTKKILLIRNNQQIKKEYCLQLLKEGFHDIIHSNDESDIARYLESFVERDNRVHDILQSDLVKNNLVGESLAWKKFLAEVIEASLFPSGSILLTGESGTGKELISRLVHTLDQRQDKKDLVILDCTTIVHDLSGSEFFGHERGSYTSAIQAREGAFALANKGTLFLDETGDLPITLQAELLRVIQEGTYKKVGSNHWQKTSFRLVCATNKDLRQMVDENKFRQDLFFRISDFEFRLPSLKERTEDIIPLANYFLGQFFDKDKIPELDNNVKEYLVSRDYRGNIRELKQLMQRIAMKHVKHRKVTIGEVPKNDLFQNDNNNVETTDDVYLEVSLKKAILSGASLWDLKDKTMHDAIKAALQLTNGNKKQAAEKLGVTARAIQQYIKKIK
jgi:transcriptional regulator with GAF, ATPase, and Fis domain